MANEENTVPNKTREHLEKSEKLAAEVKKEIKEGEVFPGTEGADDAGVQGEQQSHTPSD